MSFKLTSGATREKRKPYSIVLFFALIAAAVLSVFSVYKFVTTNIKIKELNQQYQALVEQTAAVEESNAEINRYLEEGADLDVYIEQQARERLDYAMPDEKIYYIIPYAGE